MTTTLTQIQTKANPNCYRTTWNKLILYNNQTPTALLSGPVTPPSDNKPHERQRASNEVSQRQTHACSNGEILGCVNDTAKLMR